MAKKTTVIKLGNLVQLQNELTQLIGEKISFSVKWDVRNILNSFKDEVKNLNDTINEIYKKYGEEDAQSGGYKIKADNIKEANTEINKLTEKEIKVEGKLPLKELENINSENQYFEVFALIEK